MIGGHLVRHRLPILEHHISILLLDFFISLLVLGACPDFPTWTRRRCLAASQPPHKTLGAVRSPQDLV